MEKEQHAQQNKNKETKCLLPQTNKSSTIKVVLQNKN